MTFLVCCFTSLCAEGVDIKTGRLVSNITSLENNKVSVTLDNQETIVADHVGACWTFLSCCPFAADYGQLWRRVLFPTRKWRSWRASRSMRATKASLSMPSCKRAPMFMRCGLNTPTSCTY